MLHALAHFFGLDNLSGPFYGFWSGAGSDITELGILGAAYHAFNCHENGCWRVGHRISIEDGAHVRRCKRHHREASRG